MTLIIDALNRIARQCSVDTPSTWAGATDDEYLAIRDDFFLETVDDILERVDLPSPIAAQTVITGDGSEDYDLPANFKRLQRDMLAVYETTNQRRYCIPVPDDGIWTHLKELGTTGVERYYRLKGYEDNWTIGFYEEPTSAVSITVHYITKNWMVTNGGTQGAAFTSDDDLLLLPRRVVELGTVMRFRDRNGLPFDTHRLQYEAELNRLSNDRRTRRTINFGESHGMRTPWEIPIPDFVPPA
jgi:hypothetical protein